MHGCVRSQHTCRHRQVLQRGPHQHCPRFEKSEVDIWHGKEDSVLRDIRWARGLGLQLVPNRQPA